MMRDRSQLQVIEPVAVSDAPARSKQDVAGTAEDLLRRWLELSELDRRAFIAMARELTSSSSVIEQSAIDLSERFQNLAEHARGQMARVESVIAIAQSIKVDGQEVALSEATGFIENILIKVIDTVLAVSKNAMRMVYALEEVTQEVGDAEKCVSQLHTINRQTRFLALNAAIEAARAGANGGAFSVIAHEISELAKQTDVAARTVGERIMSVNKSVRRSREVLQTIATTDLAEHIIAKEKLDALLAGMMTQNAEFNAILAETAGASAELSATIGPLTMGLQFQDRTTQHLMHVIEALGTLGQAAELLQQATHDAMPGMFKPGEIDQMWLDRIVEKQTLGTVRKRFLAQLVTDAPAVEEDTSSAGDIDLF
jgi:methyl-accepting chemotaxis protein